jgi:phage repressor protein C with HTH and peptisase S24 domain
MVDDLTGRFIAAYEWLKAVGLVKNDTEFALKIGASRSNVTEILKGRSNPGAKPLQNIVKEFPVDATWLLTGDGEMDARLTKKPVTPQLEAPNYTHTPDSTGYLDSLSELDITYNAPATKGKTAPATAPAKQVLVPQFITVDKAGIENILWVNVRASAGYVKGLADREYLGNLPSFNMPGLRNGTYRTFEVDGDSMFPTLENKEAVIGKWLESVDYIIEDYVHIIISKSQGVLIKRVLNRIKEYGYLVLKSDAVDKRNEYPNLEVYPDDILEIWLPVMHLNKKFKHPTDMYKRINNLEADLTEVMRLLKSNQLPPKSK